MKAAVSGSTGFIGTHLINLLGADNFFRSVDVLARREMELDEKFRLIVNPDISNPELENVDVAFCALGTTIKTAGSQDAFYKVDHDMVLAFARNAKDAGAKTFVLVSSVGADSRSSNFYLRVKGETERDLKQLGFESLIILRPSMLMGERKEFRFGELIGKGVMTVLNPLMFGSFAKYRGIKGETVAKAMLKLGKERIKGVHILEGDQLFAFS